MVSEMSTQTFPRGSNHIMICTEELISPLAFAQTYCQDLDLPNSHVETIVNMIRAQLDEHSGIATMDVGGDENDPTREDPDCRVILRVSCQI